MSGRGKKSGEAVDGSNRGEVFIMERVEGFSEESKKDTQTADTSFNHLTWQAGRAVRSMSLQPQQDTTGHKH